MSMLDKLKESAKRQTTSFHVEALDETIHVSFLTAGEASKLQSKHGNWLETMKIEALVDLICMKAMNKDGEKLFGLEEKPLLLKQKQALIYEIAGGILGSQLEEDPEKN